MPLFVRPDRLCKSHLEKIKSFCMPKTSPSTSPKTFPKKVLEKLIVSFFSCSQASKQVAFVSFTTWASAQALVLLGETDETHLTKRPAVRCPQVVMKVSIVTLSCGLHHSADSSEPTTPSARANGPRGDRLRRSWRPWRVPTPRSAAATATALAWSSSTCRDTE